MSQPLILLFGAHRWQRAHCIDVARERGLMPIVVVVEGEDRMELRGVDAEVWSIPSGGRASDLFQLAERAAGAAPGSSWRGAVSVDDYMQEMVAQLNERAGIRAFTLLAARCVHRKADLRVLWNHYCERTNDRNLWAQPFAVVSFPAFRQDRPLVRVFGDATVLRESAQFIVRPNGLDASIGVRRATRWEDALEVASSVSALISEMRDAAFAIGADIAPEVLIEAEIPRNASRFSSGEFTAHFWTHRGRHDLVGYSEKQIHPETFVKTSQIVPAGSMPPVAGRSFDLAVESIMTSLGVDTALSNWDVIVTPDGRAALLEGHLRAAGDELMELFERSSGVNPYSLLFDSMAGRDVERRPLMERCAGKFHLFPTATLRRITSVSIPSKLPLEVTLRIDRDGLLSRTDWQGPQTHELKFATISAEADSVDDLRRTCAAVAAAVVLSGRSADDSPATATLRIHP